MPTQHPSFAAGADIAPSIFVKLDPTADNTVIPCVADDVAIGVSFEGSRTAPIPGAAVLAAADGESCQVYGADDTCEITAGAAITAGDELKPDAAGEAVPAAAGDEYSAIARTSAADGEKVKAILTRGTLPAA